MKTSIAFETNDSVTIHADKHEPDAGVAPRGVVLVVHGILEHAGRYERFATELATHGFVTYIHDQRGHGRTRTTPGLTTLREQEFAALATDLHQLQQLAAQQYGDVPVYIFAHSMGTIVTRHYLQQYGGAELGGVILCGPAHLQSLLDNASSLSQAAIREHGYDHVDPALLDSVFGAMNASFQPARTHADWITRDEAEVDKYLADPYVQAPVTAGFLYEMIRDYMRIYDPAEVRNISERLPVLIISGDQDPASVFGAGAVEIMELFKGAGIRDVKLILYPQARHELLNELNREEATSDIIGWLTQHR